VAIEKANPKKMMLTGNHAAAYGVKLARAEAIPVYPITPQTTIMEKIIELIKLQELKAEYLPMESEHSVMAAAIGAEATGVRVFTASSSQGIAYMHENLFVASGLRLPIVMAMVNRCIGPPISIYPDHSDSLAQRDTGWIQYYVEDAQEVIDTIIQSYRVAEHRDVLLPVAVCFEGLIISHFLEPVEIPDQRLVDEFLPPYDPDHVLLSPKNVMHLSVMVNDQYFMEYKYQQEEAMENAKAVIEEVDEAFGEKFNRRHGGLIQTYCMEDAQVALLSMGSTSGLARMVVDELRNEGVSVGSIKLRVVRPFPRQQLQENMGKLKLLIVLDRDASIGMGGIVHSEVAASLYPLESKPFLVNYILGLGGRAVTINDLKELTVSAFERIKQGKIDRSSQWVGVRGPA
jgi:pyruvate/2-oxoacid:ferredoxin oxidoreductase alpha subunit